jgi:hypothetical protein
VQDKRLDAVAEQRDLVYGPMAMLEPQVVGSCRVSHEEGRVCEFAAVGPKYPRPMWTLIVDHDHTIAGLQKDARHANERKALCGVSDVGLDPRSYGLRASNHAHPVPHYTGCDSRRRFGLLDQCAHCRARTVLP